MCIQQRLAKYWSQALYFTYSSKTKGSNQLQANPDCGRQAMNTLVLLLNRESAWSPETWATQHGGERGVGGQVMIEGPSGWLSVLRDDRVFGEYDENERTAVSTMLAEPTLFLVEWKGSDLVEALLRAVPPECGAVVDNDHGVLVPIQAIHDLPLESWIRAKKLP